MSPPSFSSETTQVFRGYGLAFSDLVSLLASALNPTIGAASQPERTMVAVSFWINFIIVSFNRYLLYARAGQNTQSFFCLPAGSAGVSPASPQLRIAALRAAA